MSEYPQPGLHPDADTLSAFVEGALPEHERLACLAHFAGCVACREVVYLAEEPFAREPAPVADRVGWWKRWLKPIPVLSAAAVTGILVLSIALYRVEKPVPTAPVAMVATSSVPQAANEPSAPVLPSVQNTVEAPRVATPRRALKATLPPDNSQPVQAQVLSRPEDLPAVPQPAPPADTFQINGALSAQSSITGTITDPAGGAIPGAAVTVRSAFGAPNSGTPGVNAITDQSGEFLLAGLPPGQYEMQVSRPGFKPATKKVEVQKDRSARADSSLSVGSVAESVEVSAAAPVLNTESASRAGIQSPITSLPLAGRMIANKSATAEKDSVLLPSKLAAVATASKGKVTLAADSAGTLYRSDNAGRKWKVVKAVWQGKVVELAADSSAVAVFRLKTDTGAAWLSGDGSHWYSAPQSR